MSDSLLWNLKVNVIKNHKTGSIIIIISILKMLKMRNREINCLFHGNRINKMSCDLKAILLQNTFFDHWTIEDGYYTVFTPRKNSNRLMTKFRYEMIFLMTDVLVYHYILLHHYSLSLSIPESQTLDQMLSQTDTTIKCIFLLIPCFLLLSLLSNLMVTISFLFIFIFFFYEHTSGCRLSLPFALRVIV